MSEQPEFDSSSSGIGSSVVADTNYSKPAKRARTTPEDPSKAYLEDLERMIQEHQERRTLTRFLTQGINIDDSETPPYVIILRDEYEYDDEEDDPPEEVRVYGTPLHFACLDENGQRGQEKIKRILQAARMSFIDTRWMLTARAKMVSTRTGSLLEKNDLGNELLGDEPFQFLIKNTNSTVEAIQSMSAAYPPVIHRPFPNGDSALMTVIRDLHGAILTNGTILGKVNALLSAAQRTKEGPRPLILSSQRHFDRAKDEVRRGSYAETPLGCVTHVLKEPQTFISAILQHCPDALQRCRSGGCCSDATAPLHNILRLGRRGRPYFTASYESSVQSTLSLLRYSTVKAVAFALLYVETHCGSVAGFEDECGFVLLKKFLDKVKRISCHQDDIAEMSKLISEATDESGNTVLHFAAGYTLDVPDARVAALRKRIVFRRRREGSYYVDLNENEQQDLEARISADKAHAQQQLTSLFEWAANQNGNSIMAHNEIGQTPMDILVSTGKKWEGCLKEIVTNHSPKWPQTQSRGIQDLYPFMAAASIPDEPDLDTIYNLLRYAPQCCNQNRS